MCTRKRSRCDHLGQGAESQQIVQTGFSHTFVVGMNSGARPKIIKPKGELMHLIELFKCCANAQGARYLRPRHIQPNGIQ
jgi:hypothetical protein